MVVIIIVIELNIQHQPQVISFSVAPITKLANYSKNQYYTTELADTNSLSDNVVYQ